MQVFSDIFGDKNFSDVQAQFAFRHSRWQSGSWQTVECDANMNLLIKKISQFFFVANFFCKKGSSANAWSF